MVIDRLQLNVVSQFRAMLSLVILFVDSMADHGKF